MWGCVANCLACLPHVERVRLRSSPEEIGWAGSRPTLKSRLKLNFLEAYVPIYAVNGDQQEKWQYRGLLASEDPVAVDVIGRRILEAKRAEAKGQPWPLSPPPTYLEAAQEDYRLGQADMAKISIETTGPQEGSFLP